MIYTSSITTSKGGSEGQAESTLLSVCPGLLWLLEVDFPPGCCGLAHVQLFDGLYQVFPATPGESFHGDNVTLSFQDLYYKSGGPYELVIRTWNEDESWDHDLQVRIGMAQGEDEMSRYMPALAFKDFEQLVADMMTGQDLLRQAQLEASLRELGGL